MTSSPLTFDAIDAETLLPYYSPAEKGMNEWVFSVSFSKERTKNERTPE
jgi:hypothetical protein